jgi:hypothetical protein
MYLGRPFPAKNNYDTIYMLHFSMLFRSMLFRCVSDVPQRKLILWFVLCEAEDNLNNDFSLLIELQQ